MTAPIVVTGGAVNYTEQNSAAVLNSGLTLSDADSTMLLSAKVSISSFIPGDMLNFTSQNGIFGTYSGGVLTLSGTATVANYQAALRSISFSSTSDNPTSSGAIPSRTISWTVNDGTANSTAVTSTVNVTAVNDAPVATAGATVSYTEQGSAAVIDPGLTLSDPDSFILTKATVSISGFVAGDTLNFTGQNGIVGSYDSSTGVLTLTGSASVTNYQAALRSVGFSSTSDTPTNAGANSSRTITWTVSDGTATSTARTSTVNVTAVNDAPVATAGATVSYTEQGSAVVLDPSLTLNDADSTTLSGATVSISGVVPGDTLNFTSQNGILGNYSAGVLTLSGMATVANYQAALRSISFSSTSDNPTSAGANPSRAILWTVNDGTATSTAAISTVNVTAVNDAPVATAGATVSYTEQGPVAVLDPALTLSDPDSFILAATVSISGFRSGDTLNFTGQNDINGSYNSSTGILTLSGAASVSNYQAALRSISFSSTSDNPTGASRTITWTVNDGTTDSTAATSTVNVTAVNDAPVATAGATVSFTEQGSAVVLDPSLTLSDPDNFMLAFALVSISGFRSGDTLNFINQNGISGSYDSGTGVLTLTGVTTVANYQAALRSIGFSSTSDNPTGSGANPSRTITWTVSDGLAVSTAATSTVNVTAVNDATVVIAGATVNYTEQGSAAVLDSSLVLVDADNTTLAGAAVSISDFRSGDTLTFTDRSSIVGSYNDGTGVLTLTGAASAADYQAALRSISFSSTSDNPTGASRTITWTVNDGTTDSTAATSTVNVTAVNDAPVATAGAMVSYTGQGSAVVLDPGLTLSDPDNFMLAFALVSISGFRSGDTLNFINQNGISGSYDSGTGVLFLSGATTVANYQAALRSIGFSSTSDNPTGSGANPSRTITWTISDGLAVSTAATSTVNVDTLPVITALSMAGTTLSFVATDTDGGSLSLTSPFNAAFGTPVVTNGATTTLTPGAQASALAGALKVSDGTNVVDVVGLYLGTGGNDIGTAPNAGLSNALYGFGGNDRLYGAAGNDTLLGGDGNDQLDGHAGADEMSGGVGNDIYYVDNAGDTVTESPGEGIDTIRTTLSSYTLGAEIDRVMFTGLGNFVGTGNGLANVLTGGAGNDTLSGDGGNDKLDGGLGADVMTGGADNDLYYVDDAGDAVTEIAGGGVDTVRTTLSTYTLTSEVERLEFTGSGAFGGIGNELANRITGGAGNDTLSGGAGDDVLNGGTGADGMTGGADNDFYYVDDAGDTVTEIVGGGIDTVRTTLSTYTLTSEVERLQFTGAGAFVGIGNDIANRITGGDGDDTLNGGAGNDRLTGGAGSDAFVFSTALGGRTNLDAIVDFDVAGDSIGLSQGIFATLSAGPLSADAFFIGTAAHDADDRIIYNDVTGRLSYDVDGSGAGAATQFASLAPGLALTHDHLFII